MSLRSISEISSHTRMPPDRITIFDGLMPTNPLSVRVTDFVVGALALIAIAMEAYETYIVFWRGPHDEWSFDPTTTAIPEGLTAQGDLRFLDREHSSLPDGFGQINFSYAASAPTQIFTDLDTALTFWVEATNDETLANPPITITLRLFIMFLSSSADLLQQPNIKISKQGLCWLCESSRLLA